MDLFEFAEKQRAENPGYIPRPEVLAEVVHARPKAAVCSKFIKMADNLTDKIADKRRAMTQNPTPKRNKEYHCRLWEADNMERLQKLLRAISETLPAVLNGITKKADLAKLVYKGADQSRGYYSFAGLDNYALDTPEALAAQKLIEGSSEENRLQREANEISIMKQSISLQKIDDFYPTPDVIIERMIDYADIQDSDRVLEPSAGTGNILDHLPNDTMAIEFNMNLFEYLKKTLPGANIIQGDFLEMNGEIGMFDKIVMNPPFSRGADIKHIKHAMSHLNEGGKLVALCAGGPNQARELMPLSDLWEDLPQGTFKQAGTMVNACLCVITK